MGGLKSMGELKKMQIIAFADKDFCHAIKNKTIELQINPTSLKYSIGLSYSKDKSMGKSSTEINFERSNGSTLSFDFVFDDTGVIPRPQKKNIVENKNLVEMISNLETIIYKINGETHEPNYLQINWGSFLFKGRMSSLSYDYTLFRPDGSPLRVKVSMTIKGYMNKLKEAKIVALQSSDLSRIITLKAGENIPLLCKQIYGDSSYCFDVADYNNLADFRNLQIGTQLMFPPLSHGEISK